MDAKGVGESQAKVPGMTCVKKEERMASDTIMKVGHIL